MSDFVSAHPVEFLAVARAYEEGRPSVVITIRPEPGSWRPHNLALAWPQAERLRDDLIDLLKTPAAFILIAVLALATGCSARVEVVNERPAAVEADSVAAPVAFEKHRTAVKVDFLGQQQTEPAVTPVANEQRTTTTEPVPLNLGGIQVNGDENRIEFHYHRHRRSRSPVLIYPLVRHEMVIVPSDGSSPVVFMDNAPPRVAVVDKEVARAYAEHMLRLAEKEGHR